MSSLLTYKVRHNRDLTNELRKAKEVAEFAVTNKGANSSKEVKHIGLPSAISNQILRKYGRNKKAKRIHSVKLTIPNQAIKQDKDGYLRITCLDNLLLPFNRQVIKINQIELGQEYAYITCSIGDKELISSNNYIGIDLNTTGYAAVVADPKTGKVQKYNKAEQHYRRKYRALAAKAQRKKNFKLAKKHRNKERRKIKDINHKVSRTIVNKAYENKQGIRMEKLYGIRDNLNKKTSKTNRKTLNNWSFYQLQQMIEYKAKLLGIPLEYINPEYTSQECSRCGLIGERKQKEFKCLNKVCGHYDNADTNAAFNIANRSPGYKPGKHYNSTKQRTLAEGTTDAPRSNMKKAHNFKSSKLPGANPRTPSLQ